ncbi:MAG: WhiB family transcriptional regulator [Actinomycetota bacterium]|jgi:WhiB family redox-sensing transcriptional regulator|nr:WhiB family transcriptional regulator [Acidimicrobiia bacterium]MDQ3357606.1 WhiB family transcriptional regulator [Actinomycetota bacterium]MDQ3527830.1 WhiB family transcriptional regulator [Actinomycetota bacterium]
MAAIAHQPGPVAELWEWQFKGLCRTVSPELFFHPEGERGPARRRRDERAKQLCLECPVLEQCRDHALSAREPYGVWGAMTEDERETHYARQEDRPA